MPWGIGKICNEKAGNFNRWKIIHHLFKGPLKTSPAGRGDKFYFAITTVQNDGKFCFTITSVQGNLQG